MPSQKGQSDNPDGTSTAARRKSSDTVIRDLAYAGKAHDKEAIKGV